MFAGPEFTGDQHRFDSRAASPDPNRVQLPRGRPPDRSVAAPMTEGVYDVVVVPKTHGQHAEPDAESGTEPVALTATIR